MKKTIIGCDVCHKEVDSYEAENWLSVTPPEETRVSFNSVSPWHGNIYGLYCSIDCLLKRIAQKAREDRGEYEPVTEIRAGGSFANMKATDHVGQQYGMPFKDHEKLEKLDPLF